MSQAPMLHTGRASLCARGAYLRRRCVFAPRRAPGKIPPKTVRPRPLDQVLEVLVGILCGTKTMAQSHVTMRPAPAVQRACGRTGWADQATIARPRRACTTENGAQLERVSWYDLQRSGATPRPRCHAPWLGGRVIARLCLAVPRQRGASAPGWAATAVKRGGTPGGARRVPSGQASTSPCCGAKRPPCRPAQRRSRRWKPSLDGRGRGAGRWSGVWTGAWARPRCATGGAGGALRAWPKSVTGGGCGPCDKPSVPGSLPPGQGG